MPHLDAKALASDDPKGLEFLASVIDVPAEHPQPAWVAASTEVAAKPVRLRVLSRRRKSGAPAVEPA